MSGSRRESKGPAAGDLLSVEQAAALLGVTRDTIYRAIKAKRLPLPVYVIGKRMRIPRAAVDRLLAGIAPEMTDGQAV